MCKGDGAARVITLEDIVIGNVFRRYGGGYLLPVFSDCTVVAINGEYVTLDRPMVYADGSVHVERFEAWKGNLIDSKFWKIVLLASGKSQKMPSQTKEQEDSSPYCSYSTANTPYYMKCVDIQFDRCSGP